jgi:hypothetical protein
MVRLLGTNREIKICAFWTWDCRNGEVVGFMSSVVELWIFCEKARVGGLRVGELLCVWCLMRLGLFGMLRESGRGVSR